MKKRSQQADFSNNSTPVTARPERVQSRYGSNSPGVMNMDEIAVLLDEELYARIGLLETGKSRAFDARQDTFDWEVEIAYARREALMRRERRVLHERFVAEQARAFALEEMNLPTGDFDNYRFMVNN